MGYKINFPALVIDKSSIVRINYRFLVGDKRLIRQGYRDVLIVDSEGNCFDTKEVEQSGGLSLYYSIKLIGLMVKLNPVLKQPVFKISIEELKGKLIALVNKHPQKFSALLPKQTLIQEIKEANSYIAIINIF
jgi:hypothetical protein